MKKLSLQEKMIRLFIITSTLPIIILGFFYFYNISHTLKDNMEVMSNNNLRQIDNNLNIRLESYEDLLYQIYTNDNMVMWVDNLNNGVDEAVTVNQMRRFLNALLNTKEYVRAISIIAPNGVVVTYEQMTPATYRSSWLDNFSISKDAIYKDIIKDYEMHIYPTEFATNFANKDYYLLHIAHRIIDYKNLEKECGVAILSIDEGLLQDVCLNSEQDSRIFNFIVDENGRIITYGEDAEKIGDIVTIKKQMNERKDDYISYYEKQMGQSATDFSANVYHDDDLSWDIVNVTDMSDYMRVLKRQFELILLLGIGLMLITILFSTKMSQNLITSVKKVVQGMERAQDGDLSIRVAKDADMALEIENIADGFNDTLEKLNNALTSQQEAQIMAMEAQINPHFLYNTLDTINWMAIDKDEYDISNAISSLATILRYAIVNSNEEVTIKDEIEWLKKYIYLQQFRLKNNFSCSINTDADADTAYVHKLLLQPFVENAIMHGFEKEQENAVLKVIVHKSDDCISIYIEDNGCGMDDRMIDDINNGIYANESKGTGIGMKNAATRLKMYYGNNGRLRVEKASPRGTKVTITIPYKEKQV